MPLWRKFQRAVLGLREVFWSELSIKIEVAVAVAVLGMAYFFSLSKWEFFLLFALAFMVIIVEGLNTILEAVIDLAEPRYHEAVRRLKDALAALVLLSVLLAVIGGLAIFWPYLNK